MDFSGIVKFCILVGRGFITPIHIMASQFNIIITVFKIYRRKISILNTKYYGTLFEKLRVRKINKITK